MNKKTNLDSSEKKITRKEAIKKTGYMALSTATMMILLNKNAGAMIGGKYKNWSPENCEPQTSGGGVPASS